MTTVNVTRGDATIIRITTAGPQGPAGGGGGAGTDLSYDAATRLLSSSTGADVTLPEATTSLAGLQSAADKALVNRAATVTIAVRNVTGATIAKGTPVYVTGSSGVTITVAPADASTEATAAGTLGLTEAAIAHNSNGTVIAVGELTGLNTAALAEGALIWLSETTGQLTTTRPTQPAHGVVIGYCVKQGSGTSGIVYVKVDNGLELDELHDVLITTPSTGQVLRRAADGLWKNATLGVADVSGAVSGVTGTAPIVSSGGTTPAISITAATTSAAGSMSAADKTKLDGVAAGATANSTDAQLRDRSTHTGTQAGSTVTGAYTASGLTLATSRLLGRSTAGTGAAEEIIIGSGLSLVGGTLTATGGGGGGSGTVTSVGLSLPAIFTVSGSPVTTSGTLSAVLATQSANLVLAGPTTGAAAVPTFRALDSADLPTTATFSVLSATGQLTLPASAAGSPSIGNIYRVTDTIRYRDSSNTERLLLNSADNLANLGNIATARSNIGAAASGAIGSSGLTMATARLLGRTTASTGAPEEITVGSGLSLAGGTLTATGGGGASFSGYAVGNWIQPANGTVAAGASSGVNTVFLYPFEVDRSITVSDLGARVTTLSTGNFQLAIYASSDGLPTGTPLANTASLLGTSATTVSGSVTAFNLTAGALYWGAVNVDATTTFQQLAAANNYFASVVGTTSLAEIASAAAVSGWYRSVSSTYGTWPDLTGSTNASVPVTAGTPRGALVYLKVSALL